MSNASASDVNMPIPELEAVLDNLKEGEISNVRLVRNKKTARVPVIEMALDRVAEAVQLFGKDAIPTEPIDEAQYEAAKANFLLSTSVQALDTSIEIIRTLKGGSRNNLPKIWPKGRKVVPHVEKITRLREEIGGLMEPIEIMHRRWHAIRDANLKKAKPTIDKAISSATTAISYHNAVAAAYESIEQGLISGADDWWVGAAKQMGVNAPLAMLDELAERNSVIPEYKGNAARFSAEAFELTGVEVSKAKGAEGLEDITRKYIPIEDAARRVSSIGIKLGKLVMQVETAKDLVECLKVGRFSTVEYSADEINSLQAKIRKDADELPERYAATTARFKTGLRNLHWRKAMQDVQKYFAAAAEGLIASADQYKGLQIRSLETLDTEIEAAEPLVAKLKMAAAMCESGVKYERAAKLEKAYKEMDSFRMKMLEIRETVPDESERLSQGDVSDFTRVMDTAQREHSYGAKDEYFQEVVSKAGKILSRLQVKMISMQDFKMTNRSGLDPRLKPLVDSVAGVSGSIPSISQAQIELLDQYQKEIRDYKNARRGVF